jgi:hypothetical protein
METVKPHLEELGRFVAEQSDAASDPQSVLAEVQARLARPRPRPWADFARPAFAGALVVVFGIAAFSFLTTGPGPITYEVSRVREAQGGWIATQSEPARLEFSEGTLVEVYPETRLRVSESRENGATVVIERGRVVAHVEHQEERRDWRFHAGPYLVQVTGTEFEVSWDASKSLFELALHEGSVVVSGPNLARDRTVRAGDVLRVSALAQEPHVNREPAAQKERSPGAVEPTAADAQPKDVTRPTAQVSQDQARQNPETLDQKRQPDAIVQQPAWRKALAEGHRSEVLVELVRAGGASALGEASEDELWQIADAARVGGQPMLAQGALLRLRERGARGQTAYLLGKIAVDQRGVPSEAIRWFKTYLQESPRGPLSEQALGRLVELGAGSAEGRAFAGEYLRRFPDGAYVPFARSQLAP